MEISIRGGGFASTNKSGLSAISASTRSSERKLLARLVQDEHLSTNERRSQQEINRIDQICCKTLSALISIQEGQFQSAVEIQATEPDSPLTRAIRQLIESEGRFSIEHLKLLATVIRDYEEWVGEAEKNETFIRLCTASFKESELTAALRRSGARFTGFKDQEGEHADDPMESVYYDELPEGRKHDMSDLLLEGEYELTQSFPDCFHRFSDYQKQGKGQAWAFLAWLEQIKALGPALTGALIKQFMEIVGKAEAESSLPMGSHFFAYQLSQQIAFGEVTIPAIEALKPFLQQVAQIKALGAEEIFLLLGETHNVREIAPDLISGITEAGKVSPRIVKDLSQPLRMSAPNERFEVFKFLVKVPALISIMRAASQFQIAKDDDVLSKMRDIFNHNPLLARIIVDELAVFNKLEGRKPAVAHALYAPKELLMDVGSRTKLFNCIRQFSKFHLVTSNYIDALVQGDQVMVKILDTALEQKQKGDELKLFVDRLVLMGSPAVHQLLTDLNGDSRAVVASISTKRFAPNQTPAQGIAEHAKKVSSRPWVEELFDEFAAGKYENNNQLTVEQVRIVYDYLSPELTSRLRSVWQRAPHAVSYFCAHVLEFWENGWFRSLIEDSLVFSKYREKLGIDPLLTGEKLRDATSAGTHPAEEKFRDWLLGRDQSSTPLEIRAVTKIGEVVPPALLNRKFDRIVLWGRFRTQERNRKLLEAAAGVDLVLHDTSDHHLSGREPVHSGDLVICLIGWMNHKQYFHIKRRVLAQGAELVCTMRDSTEMLAEIISTIASNKNRAA